MYLITKPELCLGVQVRVKVEGEGNYKKVYAELGDMADWVCVVNHDGTTPPPPAGFGTMMSAGGVPHIHNSLGVYPLEDNQWLVALNNEPRLFTDSEVNRLFIKTPHLYGPTWQQKEAWARTPKLRADAPVMRSQPKELQPDHIRPLPEKP